MITVHNLPKSGVATPLTSSIVYDAPINNNEKVAPGGTDGWQVYSGRSTITWTSPATTVETQTNSAKYLSDATMDNVNRARYVDIAIATGADDLSKLVAKTGETHLLSASQFGNWRWKSRNGFAEISKRVYLQTKDVQHLKYGITYSPGNLSGVIKNNAIVKTITKLSDTVNNLAATASGIAHMAGWNDGGLGAAAITGERMSRFDNFPILKLDGTKTTGGLDSITFEFRFGQAGIFSGEEEVVKPILALVNTFSLHADRGHSVVGPFPTETTANRKAMLKTLEILSGGSNVSLKMETSDLEDNTSLLSTAVSGFNALTDKVYAMADAIAGELLGLTKTITFIQGGAVTGPFVVTNVSWEFDFNNVDEYGFPCYGTVTFGGLQNVKLMVGSDYIRQWGYKIGETYDMDPVLKQQLVENGQEKVAFAAEATDGKQAESAGSL